MTSGTAAESLHKTHTFDYLPFQTQILQVNINQRAHDTSEEVVNYLYRYMDENSM